jgi:hypothetical protein
VFSAGSGVNKCRNHTQIKNMSRPKGYEKTDRIFVMRDFVSVEAAIVKSAENFLQQLMFRSMSIYPAFNQC